MITWKTFDDVPYHYLLDLARPISGVEYLVMTADDLAIRTRRQHKAREILGERAERATPPPTYHI